MKLLVVIKWRKSPASSTELQRRPQETHFPPLTVHDCAFKELVKVCVCVFWIPVCQRVIKSLLTWSECVSLLHGESSSQRGSDASLLSLKDRHQHNTHTHTGQDREVPGILKYTLHCHTHLPVGVSACSALIGQQHTNGNILLAEASLQLVQGAEACACICVCERFELITSEPAPSHPPPSASGSLAFMCVCACRTVSQETGIWVRGRSNARWAQQFERLVIQTGVCPQTFRTLCLSFSSLWWKRKGHFCLQFQL